MDKETIVTIYKAIARSLLNYAATTWTSFLSDTQWRELKTSQNNALRIATGCVKMTNIDHLHEKTSMLTIKEHNKFLTKQYLIAFHLTTHPNYRTVNNNPNFRHIRLDPTIVNTRSVKEARNSLHQSTVTTARNQLGLNRVINRHPPPVSYIEKRLPRVTRTILSQLRSGWSNTLNSFIGQELFREARTAIPYVIKHHMNRCAFVQQSRHRYNL